MDLYVVLMYRYGNTESHSYLHGVYDTLTEAKVNAESEYNHRGRGKYHPQILRTKLNHTKDREIMFQEPDGEMSALT